MTLEEIAAAVVALPPDDKEELLHIVSQQIPEHAHLRELTREESDELERRMPEFRNTPRALAAWLREHSEGRAANTAG